MPDLEPPFRKAWLWACQLQNFSSEIYTAYTANVQDYSLRNFFSESSLP